MKTHKIATTVLDSPALLAYFWDGTGAEKLENLLSKAALLNRPLHMTELSYTEVKSSLLQKGGSAAWQRAAEVMIGLPIEFHACSRQLAEIAGELKFQYSIGLENAFILALAQEKKAEIVTGDQELATLHTEHKIVLLGAE